MITKYKFAVEIETEYFVSIPDLRYIQNNISGWLWNSIEDSIDGSKLTYINCVLKNENN